MSLKKCAPALLAVLLAAGSRVGYVVSLTDERQGRADIQLEGASLEARVSQVRSMTRIMLAAIAFAFGAAMSAQAGEVSPPSFGPAGCANSTFFSCRDARPQDQPGAVSQDQVAPRPKQEAPKARAAQKADNGTSPIQETQAVQDASAVQTADALGAMATPGTTVYRIGPLDVLDITVFQAPDISGTVEVSDEGTIDLPLLGQTPVAGKSAPELQRELRAKLGAKYLQNPQVSVRVKEFNSNRVTVSGAVKSPGVFPYKGETLLQYVVKAGGLAPEANSMVLVLRQGANGKRSAGKFNINDIEEGRAQDPTMQSGDVIVADTSMMKTGINKIFRFLPLAGFAALL
jgi:polysaccharide export outer membrane protein